MGKIFGLGQTCVVTREIRVDGRTAFRKNERVTVERVDPHPEHPDYKYVIRSNYVNEMFFLSDRELRSTSKKERLTGTVGMFFFATLVAVLLLVTLSASVRRQLAEVPRAWLYILILMGMAIVVVPFGLGYLTGTIAEGKGYNFFKWSLVGFFLPGVGLAVAYFMEPNEFHVLEGGRLKKCPNCPEWLPAWAVRCSCCGTELGEESAEWSRGESSLEEILKEGGPSGQWR